MAKNVCGFKPMIIIVFFGNINHTNLLLLKYSIVFYER